MNVATYRDKSIKPVALTVIVLHVLLVLLMIYYAPAPVKKNKNREKLVVKTLKLQPYIETPAAPTLKPETVIAEAPPQVVENLKEEVQEKEIPEVITEPPPVAEPALPTPAPAPVPSPVVPKEKPKLIKKSTLVSAKPIPIPPPPIPKEKPTPKPQPAAKPIVKPAPKPASKPIPKKEVTKSEPVKSVQIDPKIEAERKRKQDLLAKAQGNLAKLNSKPSSTPASQVNNTIALPKQLGELSVDNLQFDEPGSTLGVRERGYRDELASRLKLMLKLPEYGIVKLKLTLNRLGKVIKLEILSSESSLNRKHIEKSLSSLSFPPLGDNFAKEKDHTFQITLSSD